MLSILICSTDAILTERLSENIRKTSSLSHELIIHPNNSEPLPIAKAYNLLAGKAKGNSLLFLHQDVVFHGKGWAEKIITLLRKPEIGLIGASGCIYKSSYPGSWSMTLEEFYRMNGCNGHTPGVESDSGSGQPTKAFEEVVAVDGFLMAMRKEVWEQNRFNENELRGFHFYDLEMAIQLKGNMKVIVADGLDVEHLSKGSFDKNWIAESISWHRRHQQTLPLIMDPLPRALKRRAEYRACSGFTWTCIREQVYPGLVFRYLLCCFWLRPVARFNAILIKAFILPNRRKVI